MLQHSFGPEHTQVFVLPFGIRDKTLLLIAQEHVLPAPSLSIGKTRRRNRRDTINHGHQSL